MYTKPRRDPRFHIYLNLEGILNIRMLLLRNEIIVLFFKKEVLRIGKKERFFWIYKSKGLKSVTKIWLY